MQNARDRLAGELGKQTGVAVQLSPPQRWDQPARHRRPAVRHIPPTQVMLGDCSVNLHTHALRSHLQDRLAPQQTRDYRAAHAACDRRHCGAARSEIQVPGTRRDMSGVRVMEPGRGIGAMMCLCTCRTEARWTTRELWRWPSTW